MSFFYSFNLSDDLDHFGKYPHEVQAEIERHIVDVIYESFVIPGDQDYLAARLLAQKGLPRGFYWAAAQTVEKYLKAFLLLNGHAVKQFGGHPIRSLCKAASAIDSSIVNIDVTPHADINIENSMRRHLKNFTLSTFLDDVETHGSADNRYNSFGVEYNTGHLFALDSLAFALRGKIGVPSIMHSFKKIEPSLISMFEDNNPWFCSTTNKCHTSVSSAGFPLIYSMTVTKLEFVIKHKNSLPYAMVLEWLRKKMKLPTGS